MDSFQESYQKGTSLDLEFRIKNPDKSIMWHWLKANPEKKNDGAVVWFGTIQNISQKKKCLEALEKMLFDLSHVFRKPTSNILGCIEVLKNGENDEEEIEQMIHHIENQTHTLESFIRNLNSDYLNLKSALNDKWS